MNFTPKFCAPHAKRETSMSGPPPAFPPSPPATPPLPPPIPGLPPTPPPVRTCGFIGCSVEDHLGIYLGVIFGLLCCCALCTYSVYKTVLRPRGVTESLEPSRGDGAGRSGDAVRGLW